MRHACTSAIHAACMLHDQKPGGRPVRKHMGGDLCAVWAGLKGQSRMTQATQAITAPSGPEQGGMHTGRVRHSVPALHAGTPGQAGQGDLKASTGQCCAVGRGQCAVRACTPGQAGGEGEGHSRLLQGQGGELARLSLQKGDYLGALRWRRGGGGARFSLSAGAGQGSRAEQNAHGVLACSRGSLVKWPHRVARSNKVFGEAATAWTQPTLITSPSW